ncbi:MAG TPA: M48 family metalloprotease, partial [Syntrophomonadaceae bacterium]|nr:M48 family metalloprotease [Syntrophomonadaceae bacterium]
YILSMFVREEMAGIVHFIAVIVFQILFSILGSIAVMAFSRRREFAADQGGAQIAGRQKMIHALESLKSTVSLVDNRQEALATFKISGEKKMGLAQLMASHPSLDDRINRLKAGY